MNNKCTIVMKTDSDNKGRNKGKLHIFQGVQLECQHGIRSQKPYSMLFVFGPTSKMALELDPVGSACASPYEKVSEPELCFSPRTLVSTA